VGIVTIDGVATSSTTTIDPVTGATVDTLTVPIISSGRVEDPGTPNAVLADIPLGIANGAGGASATLTVSLPNGTGLVAAGPTTLLSNANALTDLIQRIESKTVHGSSVQADMTGRGAAFLSSLGSGVQLETKTLTLSTGGSAAQAQPIQITGAQSQNGAAVALVIDGSPLPQGSVISLNNVEFAAIVGAVTVTGGDGRNFVIGDGAAQRIFLGADDDELHGGGGDDIVGSAGGNDLVDGGDGNDIVIGGIGNDTVQGGSGNDLVVGGRSDVGQWSFFLSANGTISASHEMSVLAPGKSETVSAAELDTLAPGLGFMQASASKLSDLALLYHAAFGRAADLGGLEFWAASTATAQDVMSLFMQNTEYQLGKYAGLGDDAFIRAVYTTALGRAAEDAGVAFWLGQLSKTGPAMSRAQVLTAIALSDEHKAMLGASGQLTIGQGSVQSQHQWFGSSGNDTLVGGAGSDTLVGGDGTDTVVYAGARSQYHVMLGKDGEVRIVDSANGDVDLVKGIERGQFGDGTIDLSFTQAKPAALQALGLLYQSLFDRAADIGGLSWWLGHGGDTTQVAQAMTGSDEYKAQYAGVSDAAFVQSLFAHTGLQASQAGGIGWWQDYAAAHGRAETLAAWVANADVIGVQFGADGLWLV
jgi:Ca2+-binding RTX toxin-like protein